MSVIYDILKIYVMIYDIYLVTFIDFSDSFIDSIDRLDLIYELFPL